MPEVVVVSAWTHAELALANSDFSKLGRSPQEKDALQGVPAACLLANMAALQAETVPPQTLGGFPKGIADGRGVGPIFLLAKGKPKGKPKSALFFSILTQPM